MTQDEDLDVVALLERDLDAQDGHADEEAHVGDEGCYSETAVAAHSGRTLEVRLEEEGECVSCVASDVE